MDDSRRCTARSSRTGQRCKKAAVIGATVCATHGGAAPQVKRAAEIRAVRMAAHAQARRMVARAGVDADPVEHLLDALQTAAAMCVIWGGMVADLDHAGEVQAERVPGLQRGWSVRTWEEGPDGRMRQRVSMDPLMVQTSDKTVQLHPFVREYHQWVTERAKVAKLCIDAGIAERQTRLAEAQAQMLAQVVRGIAQDLGVADHPDFPKVARRHLTLLAGGRAA